MSKLTTAQINSFVTTTANMNVGTKGLVSHFYNFVSNNEVTVGNLISIGKSFTEKLSSGAAKKDILVLNRLTSLKGKFTEQFELIDTMLKSAEQYPKMNNLEILTKILKLTLDGIDITTAYAQVTAPKDKPIVTFKRDTIISLLSKLPTDITKEEILDLIKA